MTDKYRFAINQPPTSSIPIGSSLRASYQPGLGAPLAGHFSTESNNIVSPRNNNNLPTSNGGVLKPPTSPQHPSPANYTMNIKHLQNKIDSVFSQLKKEENMFINKTTLPPSISSTSTADLSDLRNSISTNQIKKFDTTTNSKDFLRRTTYTPNNPKTFNLDEPTPFHDNNGTTNNHINQFGFAKKQQQVGGVMHSPQHAAGTHFHKPSFHAPHHVQKLPPSPIVCGFYLGKSLGVGKFGQVYQAKHVASGFLCALKKIVKAKVLEYNMVNQLIQEIKLQAFLSHPNIVQYYGVFSDEHNVYIALEYMEGGTLFEYATNVQVLTEPQAAGFLREVAEAVKFMHDKDIAHRDIKPQNIVLSYGLAKLCDFGWAARVNGTRKTYCGTLDYVPPEILERKQYDQTVDLWCLGILAYQLLTGKVPFQGKQRKQLVNKIVNVDKDKVVIPETLSANARDFIENLIKKNPNERLKSYKLIQHPFLRRDQKK